MSPFGILFTWDPAWKYFLVGGDGTVTLFSDAMEALHRSREFDVYSINIPTLKDSLVVCIHQNERMKTINFGLLIETLEKFLQTNNDPDGTRTRLLFTSVIVHKLQDRIDFQLHGNLKDKFRNPVIYRYIIMREAIASSQQILFPPEELFRILFHLFLEIVQAKIPLHSFPRDIFGLQTFRNEVLFDLVNIMDRALYPEEDMVTTPASKPSPDRSRLWEWILRVCDDLVAQPHWKEVIRIILLYSVDQDLVVTEEHQNLISGVID